VLACCLDDTAPTTITHLHMQALTANRKFIEALGLKPVIMLRNIADILASFLDMLECDPVARAEGLNCQVPQNFCDMDRQSKLDFVIDVISPWYASYFATWKSFVDDAAEKVCVLRYREFSHNPAKALHTAITHAGLSTTLSQCRKSLEAVWHAKESYRYNRGVKGRGKIYFSAPHLRQIERQLSYYPQLGDWKEELIGVGPKMDKDHGTCAADRASPVKAAV
jgi:hypothetical protein